MTRRLRAHRRPQEGMILVSGFNVYPKRDRRGVVVMHDRRARVRAVGVPDDKSGEAVKLFVSGRTPAHAEAVIKHCAST